MGRLGRLGRLGKLGKVGKLGTARKVLGVVPYRSLLRVGGATKSIF